MLHFLRCDYVIYWFILLRVQVDLKKILSMLGWNSFRCGLIECANILLSLTPKFSCIFFLALMKRYSSSSVKHFTLSTAATLHTFNGPLSGTNQVSRYQKGKTNLDFTEARDSEWQWHQLGRMQVCTSLQTDNHASTPPLSFFYRPDALPTTQPTASKHWRQFTSSTVLINGVRNIIIMCWNATEWISVAKRSLKIIRAFLCVLTYSRVDTHTLTAV